ncbi:hypothetical protein HYV44_02825 [Candidatus Microgenomates bacterium]|nr:hypothetical protein [Candidatus Microgenomates bacterium]
MKRIKKRQLIVGGLLATLVILAGATSTYAFAGNFGLNTDQREALEVALTNGDYDSWKGLMESQISQENFTKAQEQYKNRSQMKANRDAIEKTLEAGDYNAWKTAIAGTPMADKMADIDEATFKKMAEAHKLMKAGDKDSARAIFDELKDAGVLPTMGIGKGPDGGFGKGMHRGGMRFGF